jgi:hypothetical protein
MIPDHVHIVLRDFKSRILSDCVRSEGGPCRSVTPVLSTETKLKYIASLWGVKPSIQVRAGLCGLHNVIGVSSGASSRLGLHH